MSNIHLKRRAFFFDDPFFKSNWSDFDQVTYFCTSLPALVDLDKLKGRVTRDFVWIQTYLVSFLWITFKETLTVRNSL